MKKLLTLLLTTTISFSCLAMTETEMVKEKISCSLLSEKNTELKNYYKNKNCQKAMNLLNETYPSSSECREETRSVFAGFINGLFEEIRDCLENYIQENENVNFAWALWGIYGDGEPREESTIRYALEKKIVFDRFLPDLNTLSLLSGYYYATGNKRVFDVMKTIIQQAKSSYCFSKADPEAKLGDCPSAEQVKSAEDELKNMQQDYGDEGARKANEYLKSFYLEQIAKSKKEGCLYGPCPDQETLYFAAEFLKRYDTNWYNQNVKNWLLKKEEIYLARDKKEAEESAKRIAENERKRAERKKADDELRKMGVDLDGDTNKIGIIMYNPKTGKTQKIN